MPERYTRIITSAAAIAAIATIATAGPARADDVSFLNDVHALGMTDTQGGDAALLVTGWKVCAQLSYGATVQQIADLALQRSDSDLGAKGLTPQQAGDLIALTKRDLCPQA